MKERVAFLRHCALALLHSGCSLPVLVQQNRFTPASHKTQPAIGSQSLRRNINAPGQVVEGRPILMFTDIGAPGSRQWWSAPPAVARKAVLAGINSPQSQHMDRDLQRQAIASGGYRRCVRKWQASPGAARNGYARTFAGDPNEYEEHSWRLISGAVKTLLATLYWSHFAGLSAKSGLPYGTELRNRFRLVRLSNQGLACFCPTGPISLRGRNSAMAAVYHG